MKKARYFVALAAAFLLCSVVALAASNAPAEGAVAEPAAPVSEEDLGVGGIKVVPIEASAREAGWITQEEAVAVAKLQESAGDDAETIQASLVRLSDTQCPVLPESDISLIDRPAWVVTFRSVEMMPHGPARDGPVQADVHVIVDAATGAWLETVCGPAQA